MENTNLTIPADEIVSTTPATETTVKPVNQAPAAQIDSTLVKLPDGYIIGGFMEATPDGKHHFLKRDYVDRYAKELAATLTTGAPVMTAAAFRSAFLRDAKKLLRRGTPDGAKLTAVATMQVQATKLVAQNKAPFLLYDMIAKVTPAVIDAETFHALYTHLDSIYTYMLQSQQQKGGDT